ncbi:MAG: hypothetical protein ACE5K7_00310 [Phycisphaerae bacterium]
MANFVAYTVAYNYIGGDAKNERVADGVYYVRGHFLRGSEGKETAVPKPVWIYSYIHSISIWPTHAAVLLSMLVLARPHILATMKQGLIRGATFITVFATVVVLVTLISTVWFVLDFVRELLQ